MAGRRLLGEAKTATFTSAQRRLLTCAIMIDNGLIMAITGLITMITDLITARGRFQIDFSSVASLAFSPHE